MSHYRSNDKMERSGTSESEEIDDVDQSRKFISSPDGTEMKATSNFAGCNNVTVIQNASANVLNLNSGTATIIKFEQRGPGCSNNCHLNGTMTEGALDILVKETKDVFVETSIFKRVEESLASYHHVTISGASGEGKTSIALMIGDKYRRRGYQLMLIDDINSFRLHGLDGVKEILLIFDDIFGTVGLSTDVPHLQSILRNIHLYLGENTNNQENRGMKEAKSRPMIYVIFTTKTYILEYAISKLDTSKFSFFKDQSVFDVSRKEDCRYSLKERKAIFQKHKDVNVSKESIDVGGIFNTEDFIFGFPFTCKLFFKNPEFQKNIETFFRQPLSCLEGELSRILKPLDTQSAALILMLLCDGNLSLQQLESDSEELDTWLKAVEGIVGSITRTDIATAARHFRGTYFTEGEVIGFSHPAIYDTCALVFYNINKTFVLENCSIRFLYERVQPESSKSTAGVDHKHVIYVSEHYHAIIAERLAEAINKGKYSMSISHPILRENAVVDKVFEKLNLTKITLFDYWLGSKNAKDLDVLHGTEDDKYVLQWAVLPNSVYLVKTILTIGYKFPDDEIIQCLYTCATCGNTSVMEYLLHHYTSCLSHDSLGKALNVSVDNTCLKVIRLLIQHGADLKRLSHERQKKLFKDAAEYSEMELCQMIITAVTLIIGTQLPKNVSSSDFENFCNENLEIACIEDNFELADIIIGFSDINSRRKYDRTPVMIAASSGEKDVFDLLVKKEADLTLTDYDGDTVLHLACRGGNAFIVEHLLPSVDINSRGNNGWTPVMNAAYGGKKEVFDLLVTKGADLTLTDHVGDTVLHLACQGGNTSIVEDLLPSFVINSRGQNGWTPVMNAAYSGKKEVFDLLATNGADLTLTDYVGYTVLHLACLGGNTSIVEDLLPSFDINSRGQNGSTPVMNAAYSGKKEVLDLLVTKGADLTLTDNSGGTVLHLSCLNGCTSIVEHLLPTFDINSRGEKGGTPVMFAAYSGNKEVFDLLVTKGADLTLTDHGRDTVIHQACWGGNTFIVEHLLPLFDINRRGENGWTPVMKAACWGKKEVFDLLMKKGADLTLTDNHGDTVFHLACRGGNTSIVEDLLPSFDINSRGQHGWTPIVEASFSGKKEVFDLLVTKGADLTLTDNGRDTVLHHACRGGNRSIVEHLLPLFDINSRGQIGETPVIKAAFSGKKKVFELLVKKRADLTLSGYSGDTVLHHACWGGNAFIVEHLLPSFDINSRGQRDWTPVMMAAYRGKKEVFDLLVRKGADLTLTNKFGDTVLTLASRGGHTSIVKHLLPDSLQRDGVGCTRLHLACRGGDLQYVEYLLPTYDINERGPYDWTPLMMAARCGHLRVCRYLMSHQADLSLVSDTGEDVLNLACIGKCVKVIAELLSRDEFIKRKVHASLEGNTLLHLACIGGNVENVKNLLPDFDINVRGWYGWTPVMMAAYCGHLGVLQCLISHKADLSLVSNTGADVLCLARRGTNTDIVTFLLTLPDFSDTE